MFNGDGVLFCLDIMSLMSLRSCYFSLFQRLRPYQTNKKLRMIIICKLQCVNLCIYLCGSSKAIIEISLICQHRLFSCSAIVLVLSTTLWRAHGFLQVCQGVYLYVCNQCVWMGVCIWGLSSSYVCSLNYSHACPSCRSVIQSLSLSTASRSQTSPSHCTPLTMHPSPLDNSHTPEWRAESRKRPLAKINKCLESKPLCFNEPCVGQIH